MLNVPQVHIALLWCSPVQAHTSLVPELPLSNPHGEDVDDLHDEIVDHLFYEEAYDPYSEAKVIDLLF